VLPHWLYWGTLLLFPLVAMYLVRREHLRGSPKGPLLFVAYLFWLCSGFMGLHRLYLRNNWGLIFIPVFLLILHTTDIMRDKREDVSRTRAAIGAAVSELEHAKIPPGVTATPQMTERRSRAAQGQVGFRSGASRPGAVAQLFTLAGDPDGGDAGR
jgi:TM2 domain-containing membrane protein YozV